MPFAPSKIWPDPLAAETANAFSKELLPSDKGVFIGRLGGTDFEAVAQRYSPIKHWVRAPYAVLGKALHLKDRAPYSSPIARQHLERVRNLNGYFDIKNDPDQYFLYIQAMNQAYHDTNSFTYATKNVLDAVDRHEAKHPFCDYLNAVSQGKKMFTYSFIEWVEPFVQSMHAWAKGRKVLVVSPFSKSVAHQWERRDKLLTRVTFPEFNLATYQTPITYSTLENFRERPLAARTDNWNSEVSLIIEEILAMDFDIALMSCASYSMPIGAAIARSNRHAVYLGGTLNPMFNILGARYQTVMESGMVNPHTSIHPLEAAQLRAVTAGRKYENEGLRAYLP